MQVTFQPNSVISVGYTRRIQAEEADFKDKGWARGRLTRERVRHFLWIGTEKIRFPGSTLCQEMGFSPSVLGVSPEMRADGAFSFLDSLCL